MTYVVDFMRGYGEEWWVRDTGNPHSVQTYRSKASAERYAELMNAGVRREVAMQAVANGCEVVRTGDLVFLDVLGTSLIPAKVVELRRVPVPGAPNAAYTQVEVTVRVTGARPGYRRGELVTKTGYPQVDAVVPRQTARVQGGQIRVRSGVFDI